MDHPTHEDTTTPEPGISSAYLMWVGSDSYPDIRSWADEARGMGVSKRLPSPEVGKALMRPGVAIFVAHDEGESTDCAHCGGSIECPDCRKRAVERERLATAVAAVMTAHEKKGGTPETLPTGDAAFIRVREARLAKLDSLDAACALCRGEAVVTAGTGGYVTFEDGSVWDYRRFNYWLHQPHRFTPDDVLDRVMCEECGGTGEMPNGRVFGLFVPDRIEYIVAGDEDEEKMGRVDGLEMVERSVVVTEKKRKCGTRSAGGTYAVTSSEPDGSPTARRAVQELVEKGLLKPEEANLHGSFVEFTCPIPIVNKRFRGVKSVDLSFLGHALSDEVEMLLEAIEV
jgi:hypothetical protein